MSPVEPRVLDLPMPEPGARHYVSPGIGWVRHPLPFALDHVNCWVLDDTDDIEAPPAPVGEDTLIIDTGIAAPRTRELWEAVLAGRAPGRLLVTHFHPDHMGLAGEFSRGGTAVLGSAIETALSRRIHAVADADYGFADWYAAHGLPATVVAAARAFGNGYRKIVAEPPSAEAWQHLVAGDTLAIGTRRYGVLIGPGHAPDMVMLHDAASGILIAADQVLPTISPNISIMPLTDDPDPLASFLASLEALRALPADTLVLPSHGRPFRGLHARLDALAVHHVERLAALEEATGEWVTAFELFPVLYRRELDAQQLSFALGETLAHLAHDGRFERRESAGVVRWRRV